MFTCAFTGFFVFIVGSLLPVMLNVAPPNVPMFLQNVSNPKRCFYKMLVVLTRCHVFKFVAIAMIVVKSRLTNMRKVELKRESNNKKKKMKMMMNKVIKREIRRIRRRKSV